MIRFLAPYVVVAAVIDIAAAALYGAGSINAAALYGVMFVAIVVAGAGYVRWDERQHPHRR